MPDFTISVILEVHAVQAGTARAWQQESPDAETKAMNIDVQPFSSEEQAQAEIESAGYFPLTLDFPAETNEDHWHDFDSMVYVLDGEVTVTEAETGESCVVAAGSKLIAPGGVLHRETTAGYKALIGFSVPPQDLTQPVNKPPPAG